MPRLDHPQWWDDISYHAVLCGALLVLRPISKLEGHPCRLSATAYSIHSHSQLCSIPGDHPHPQSVDASQRGTHLMWKYCAIQWTFELRRVWCSNNSKLEHKIRGKSGFETSKKLGKSNKESRDHLLSLLCRMRSRSVSSPATGWFSEHLANSVCF
jgi:hypothetical protein